MSNFYLLIPSIIITVVEEITTTSIIIIERICWECEAKFLVFSHLICDRCLESWCIV
ncbi:MAG TPA: hypothetical protein V6C71_02625 [Coleofasciculaceae cyanobacterium]